MLPGVSVLPPAVKHILNGELTDTSGVKHLDDELKMCLGRTYMVFTIVRLDQLAHAQRHDVNEFGLQLPFAWLRRIVFQPIPDCAFAFALVLKGEVLAWHVSRVAQRIT